MEENLDTPVDSLFADILGPEYWVSDSGVSRRSWEILLLRKAMLDDHLWSLAECAERYGISRERVRQLEADAVAKLIAWKQAEDARRRARRRRLFESASRLSRALACEDGDAAIPDICCDSLADTIPAPACEARRTALRPRRTFAELRDRLLGILSLEQDPVDAS